jgi:hypothetical protein
LVDLLVADPGIILDRIEVADQVVAWLDNACGADFDRLVDTTA